MEEKKLKVLQIIADFKKGGVQADVMYPARIIDKNRVHFDVMLLSDVVGFYEDEFSNYGEIFRIPLARKKTKIGRGLSIITDYFDVYREMTSFFKKHNDYDAVESRHTLLSAPCLLAAKKAGIPVRIAHCHTNKPRKESKDILPVTISLWVCSKILSKCATHMFGVTGDACEYMFGKGKGIVVKNPTVDLKKFDPKKYPEPESDSINLIVIGSYSSRKNQKFAAEVFNELNILYPKSELTFIGYRRSERETYLDELQDYVKVNGLSERVHFLPQDSDIPYELSKATYMLIPSLVEGLPNVALEAQAMGVPCFVSRDVSDDCNCGICQFYPLNDGAKKWAENIIDYYKVHGNKKQYVDMSAWDNRQVCEMYMKYWGGKQ